MESLAQAVGGSAFLCNKEDEERNEKEDTFLDLMVGNREFLMAFILSLK